MPAIRPSPPRRAGTATPDAIACYENMLHWAQTGDGLGFDTMWLTEHHFQYEGYEVLPNLIMFGMYAATKTQHLRFGQMFNVVPQWHPLRLAEDFALADILTGGRMEFGVGRGTVPREAWSLGTRRRLGRQRHVGRARPPATARCSRRRMEVIKVAWYNERFEFRGKHFTFPPDEHPRPRQLRAGPHAASPSPRRTVDIYQPVHVARDDRVRAPRRAQGRLLAAEPREPEGEVGPLRRDPRGDRPSPVGPGRGPLPRAQRPRRHDP